MIRRLLFIINLYLLKKWKILPERRINYLLLNLLFLVAPVIITIHAIPPYHIGAYTLMLPTLSGTFVLLILCSIINDNETDDAYQRRMYERSTRESSSSDDSFSGGGEAARTADAIAAVGS